MASVDEEKGYQQGPPPMYPGTDASGNTLPPPPSYAQAALDPSEPPPTYESLYGKVKAAKSESNGVADFLKRFILLLAGTIGCTILIGLVMAVPVAMIVVGALHLEDCPAERFIPIYLVVAGSFWSFLSLMSLLKRCCCSKEDEGDEEQKKKRNPCETIINTFMFSWFIAGNVWVYRTYGNYTPDDPTAANYCDGTLFLFAFWLITATYILIGAMCCFMALSGCIAVLVNTE